MKQFIFVLLFTFALAFSNVHAQNATYKSGVSVKTLFMDYQSLNGGSFGDIGRYHHGFELGYNRFLTNNLNLNVPLKIGVVERDIEEINCLHKNVLGLDAQVEYQFYTPGQKLVPYVSLGLGGVMEYGEDRNYGDGITTDFQARGGVGLNYRIKENAYINWESEFRKSFNDNRDNLHHGIGFVFLFGKDKAMPEKAMEKDEVDSDGDGIIDDIDLCPQSAGSKELNGCPDIDGDGIADYEDKCPDFPGTKAMKGCPDTDGDGVSDADDECPNMAGSIANNGCPTDDSDNDGVANDIDKCPNIPGTAANNGCPEDSKPMPKDTDGDGVFDENDRCPNTPGEASNGGCPRSNNDADGDGIEDSQDRCPNTPGTASAAGCPDKDGDGVADRDDKCPNNAGLRVYNGCPDTDGDGIDDSRDKCPSIAGSVDTNGCPGISAEDQALLDLAMRAVQFDSGRSTLKNESYDILVQIANIMERYPNYKMSISGHTDNTGTANANQSLSERRSKACYDYLQSRGIPTSRLSFAGYGETNPIADNETLRGRALNRRVEFRLVPQ